MSALTIHLEPVAYRLTDSPWLGDLRPYEYQQRVRERVDRALDGREVLCLFLNAPTGSGKTLAAYAVPILRDIPALGVYPTNELIKDQERALRPWLDPHNKYRLIRVDSQELDRWAVALARPRHGPALEALLRWEPTVLTNPDILFCVYFGLYGGQDEEDLRAIGQRLIGLVGQYQVFVFDEFHLYNVKQVADTAFLIGTLYVIQRHYGRVFIFSSATPDSPIRPLLEGLGLPVEVIAGEAVPEGPDTRRVAQPLRLTFLPADPRAWEGPEKLREFLPRVEEFLGQYPAARLVAILDSVAGAIRLARILRERFPDRPVGEVHGFSSEQERNRALLCPITVGTSTIEVGVDFVGDRAKEVLLFEARTSSQFIQRLGRIARHGKSGARDLEPEVPYWAVALVPEYVYNFLVGHLQEEQTCTRADLYRLLEEAYAVPEDFGGYLRRHAPAEFSAARARVLDRLFMSDDAPQIRKALGQVGEALTGATEGQGWARYRQYQEERILAPLLTFRGTGLEVAIVDERGTDPGFPVKRYDLMFLLRRGVFSELSLDEFGKTLNSLEACWPEEVARERRYARLIGSDPEDLLGVYGFFRLTALLDQPRKVWFEISDEAVRGRVGQVTVLEGLEVCTDPGVPLRYLNRVLRRKRIIAWVVDRHPTAIRLGRALPPLFDLYELRLRLPGGALSQPWSIAFNQNAFFLESLGGWRPPRQEGVIVI
ncbi:MAG: type I-D CRISPR-associated helicase Cas3' [Anaerolineae bacterium]|nr:type I-D CRISPR-associated helicase Cas3' [Anaerolineae bacterium]